MDLLSFAAQLKTISAELAQAQVIPSPVADEPPPAHAVDCGPCTACCHLGVYLLPWDDPSQYQTEADGKLLKRGADGGCVYLGETGCTIYDRRPLACRTFHCGKFVARMSAEERAEYEAKGVALGNRQFARVLAEGDKRSGGLD